MWDRLTEAGGRMLQELCDGHPNYSVEVFRLDLRPNVRGWYCRHCWIKYWTAAGRPPQPLLAEKGPEA